MARFLPGHDLCTKFDPVNDFAKRRASYHFQAYEFPTIRFFRLLRKNMINGTFKIGFFIDITWRCLITLITILV